MSLLVLDFAFKYLCGYADFTVIKYTVKKNLFLNSFLNFVLLEIIHTTKLTGFKAFL